MYLNYPDRNIQYLLRMGADERVKAIPEDEPSSTPAMAARRNRHPGIADMVDVETELRSNDPDRIRKEKSRCMTHEQFKEDILSRVPQTGPV